MRTTLAVTDVTMSETGRTISGTLVTYDQTASGSLGPLQFAAGSIANPPDLKRVKLLVEHDPERPVGYLATASTVGQVITGSFYLPPGDRADTALQEAKDGLRDGLSVGVEITAHHKDGSTIVVTQGLLREVSLVAVPAQDDARITAINASTNGATMTPPTGQTPTGQTPTGQTPSAEPDPAATPPEPAGPSGLVAAQNASPVTQSGTTVTMGLDAAMSAAHTHITNRQTGHLAQALGDIMAPADAGEAVLRPQWVGELWEASLTARPLIAAIGPSQRLTGLKVQGYRKEWGDLVDEWDPDTDPQIPSTGTFETTPAEEDAQAFAGGNAIDRRYVDLGTAAFLSQWFTEAVNDYKDATEAYVSTGLMVSATTVTAQPSLLTALDVLSRAAAGRGANLDFIMMGATVWSQFISLTPEQVPWWLQAQGQISLAGINGTAAGVKFAYERTLDPEAILAGDRRSATWYEVPNPIQVQAVDIAGGKIDLGVYGYGALMVNDPAALFQTTVTP